MRKTFAVLLLTSAVCTFAGTQNTIRIQGDDTLILLSQRWSQIYRLTKPQTSIVVLGGGASVAMNALANRHANIVQSEGGKSESGITFPVGVEGIAVYVNKSNPVNQLTLKQLKQVFLGQITNWKQLGGPDKRILLYAGESSTGVLPYFQQAVLQDNEPYPFVGKASAKELVDTIAAQPEAIGYSSIYPTTNVKVLRIKGSDGLAVEASIENIRRRTYPISRYVYWHLASRPSGEVKNLCEWVLSRDGQLVVESVGYEPLTAGDRSRGLAILH